MLKVIEQFGGEIAILNMTILVFMFFFIATLLKNNKLRLLYSLIVSFFVTLQIISLYSTQSFIGYQFYVHCNLRGISSMSSLFIPHIISSIFIFTLLVVINYHSIKLIKIVTHQFKIGVSRFQKLSFVLIFTFLSLVTISLKGNFIKDSKSLFTLFNNDNNLDFNKVLEENSIQNYTSPEQIESKAGKNIIIISLESIERGFFSEKFAHLTPNLKKLKNSWNYYDINQNVGSGWTSGSLYTSLTGFPAFFGQRTNKIFKESYNSKISSISHVLKKANYQTTFMNGDSEFSGVNDMLFALKFDKIIDAKNTKKTGFESFYGIRDKDLFDLAKDEIDINLKQKKPFALYISTTDTHFPDGIYDHRMESIISKKDSPLEFMVAAVDYMVGDLISHLKSKNMLENTAVYIIPDHLKMGDPTLFNNTGDRGLYLITNATRKDVNVKTSENLYQIDLPKMILNGAKVKHNQKFFTDYISGNKDQYIRENINSITAINVAGISKVNTESYSSPKISKRYEKYKKDTSRYIAHAGGIIDGHTYTNSLEAMNLSYEKGFRLFELDIIKTQDEKYVAAHDWKDWKSMTGYEGKVPITYKEFKSYKLFDKYTPLSIDQINEWFKMHPDATLISDKINEPKLFSKAFIDPNRLIMELFTQEAVEEGVNIGLLSSMPTQHVIENMDRELILKLKIKHVAVSRFFIASNKGLLKWLKDNNIKVYVYNVNQDESLTDTGIDEDYVTKYELDFVHGMYADNWIFE